MYYSKMERRSIQWNTDAGTDFMRVVDKIFAIIEELSRGNLGVSELSRLTGLSKSTVHNNLSGLVDLGYVSKDSRGRYQLTYRFVSLSQRFLAQVRDVEVVRPIIKELSEETQATVHFGVLDRDCIVYVEKVDSPRPVRMASYIGKRIPLHCTALGKAALAFLPPDEASKILDKCDMQERTSNTITEREELVRQLEEIRKVGYAVDNEENEEGIRCIAAPVFGYEGVSIAAVSISDLLFHYKDNDIAKKAEQVMKAASGISEGLGVRNP